MTKKKENKSPKKGKAKTTSTSVAAAGTAGAGAPPRIRHAGALRFPANADSMVASEDDDHIIFPGAQRIPGTRGNINSDSVTISSVSDISSSAAASYPPLIEARLAPDLESFVRKAEERGEERAQRRFQEFVNSTPRAVVVGTPAAAADNSNDIANTTAGEGNVPTENNDDDDDDENDDEYSNNLPVEPPPGQGANNAANRMTKRFCRIMVGVVLLIGMSVAVLILLLRSTERSNSGNSNINNKVPTMAPSFIRRPSNDVKPTNGGTTNPLITASPSPSPSEVATPTDGSAAIVTGTVQGMFSYSSLCWDAHPETHNLYMVPCNESNPSQRFFYNATTKQIRHYYYHPSSSSTSLSSFFAAGDLQCVEHDLQQINARSGTSSGNVVTTFQPPVSPVKNNLYLTKCDDNKITQQWLYNVFTGQLYHPFINNLNGTANDNNGTNANDDDYGTNPLLFCIDWHTNFQTIYLHPCHHGFNQKFSVPYGFFYFGKEEEEDQHNDTNELLLVSGL